jgi:hypothetical protein
MEIRSRVFAAQQNLLAKVEAIRDNCLLVNQVLENLTTREREAGAARGHLPRGCDSHKQQGFGKFSQVHHFRADQRKNSIERMGAQHLRRQDASQESNEILRRCF